MARRKEADRITPENPEWTEEDFGKSRPGREVFGELGLAVPPKRGRPPADRPKRQVTLRLDAEIVEHFKSGGPGWQTRINETLARSVARQKA